MMLSCPLASRAFSTTFFMSHGDRNCPFLIFTGLPALATAWIKSVWRHRNAGIDDEAGFKEAPEVVSGRAQSDAISLISPEGDEPLRVQPRQRLAHRNEACPEAPCK